MDETNKNWPQFFETSIARAGGASQWLENKWKSHQAVYDVLEQLAPKGKMFEIGCGMAATSIAMSFRGLSCTALDNDSDVLRLAGKLSQEVHAKTTFVQGDMFDLARFLGQFDIVYSGGVLEHLDEKSAVKLLAEQGNVARYVVTVIPTKSEEQKAPIPRYPYGVRALVDFGTKAGLKSHSVLLFKGIEPKHYVVDEQNNIDDFIVSLNKISAQRIGVVFEKATDFSKVRG